MRTYTQEEKDGFKKHLIKAAEKTIPFRIQEQENSINKLLKKTTLPCPSFNDSLKEKANRIKNMLIAINYLKNQLIPNFESLPEDKLGHYFSHFHSYNGKDDPEYKISVEVF